MQNFNWKLYNGNITWLKDRTIYLTLHGSNAYGTNIATSDIDIRGIAIAPKEYYFGCSHKFEQAESKDPDLVIFELRKFINLASACNPNALEIIFTDDNDHFLETKLGQKLIENRDMFLSKKAYHTFSGYAKSQLNRLKSHYNWLHNPITSKPTRQECGLPEKTLLPKDQLAAIESAIQKQLDSWCADFLQPLEKDLRIGIINKMNEHLAEIQISMQDNLWIGAARIIGLDDNVIELLDKERRYTSKKREFDNYQTWLKSRNPVRAELEAKFGMDTKHAMHLVRLMKMCKEVLSTGKLIVKRPDAEELKSIRAGSMSYQELIEWFEKSDKELLHILSNSKLPDEPPHKKINTLCMELVEQSFE